MRRRAAPGTWTIVLAAGLLLRPVFIVPMAPGGPLGSSDLLPVALASVFAFSALLAVGVFMRSPLAIAFTIVTAFAGLPVAVVGAVLGLPMPWPLVLAGYNLALAVVGIKAWSEPPRRGATAPPR